MKESGEIKNDVLVQLQASTTIGFYTDDILNDWIDKGHKYCAGFKKWPFTEGRVSTTYASLVTDEDGMLRGEYHEGWKPDSIRLLRIGGKRFDKKDFEKFYEYFEDNSSSTEKFFTDKGLSYYVNANAGGSGSVVAWGQFTPATIDGSIPTSTTVFSNNAEEGNEAIVEMVMSYAKQREKKTKESLAHKSEAVRLLNELWGRIEDEQYQYQVPPNDGMFERFDVLEGALTDDLFRRDQFN